MSRRNRFAIVALCAPSLACTTMSGQSSPPPDGRFGNVYLAAERFNLDKRKVVAVSYRVANDRMTVADVVVAYGTESSLPAGRADYVAELLSSDGRILASRSSSDPRMVIVEREGNAMLLEGVLTTRLAFDPSVARARVRRPTDGAVLEHDIRSVVVAFCSRNRADPDCAQLRMERSQPR